jgi:hypothetical protein
MMTDPQRLPEPLTLVLPAGAAVTWCPPEHSRTGCFNRLRVAMPNGWVLSLINYPFVTGTHWEAGACWDHELISTWDGLDEAGVQAKIDQVAAWKPLTAGAPPPP